MYVLCFVYQRYNFGERNTRLQQGNSRPLLRLRFYCILGKMR